MYDTVYIRTKPMLQTLIPLLCQAAQGVNVTINLMNNGMYAVRAPRHAFKSRAVKEVIGGGVGSN